MSHLIGCPKEADPRNETCDCFNLRALNTMANKSKILTFTIKDALLLTQSKVGEVVAISKHPPLMDETDHLFYFILRKGFKEMGIEYQYSVWSLDMISQEFELCIGSTDQEKAFETYLALVGREM